MSSLRLQNCNSKSNLKQEEGGKQAITGDCHFNHYVPSFFWNHSCRLRHWLMNKRALPKFQLGFVKDKRTTHNIFITNRKTSM